MLASCQRLQDAWSVIEPVTTLAGASVQLGVTAWAGVCPTQIDLDTFLWEAFKLRYGDQDKIAAIQTVPAPAVNSVEVQHLQAAIDGILDACRQNSTLPVLLWEPAVKSLLRVTKNHAANPVIRKQCYKFAFDWLRSAIGVVGNSDFGQLCSLGLDADTEPPPVCTCTGFPIVESGQPCVIHSTIADAETVSTAAVTWKPVAFRYVVALVCAGLTDVWSAIRKDVSNRLFSIVDLLPMPYVSRIVTALVKIAALKDRRETYWREQEGSLLGLAIILKKFRRAGARELDEPPSPSTSLKTPVDVTRTFRFDVGSSSGGGRTSTPTFLTEIGRSQTHRFPLQPVADSPASEQAVAKVPFRGLELPLITPEADVLTASPSRVLGSDSPRSPRWDRRSRSDADRSGRASPRHLSLTRSNSKSSRLLYRATNLTERATRILEAIAAHPSTATANLERGLWFGGKLLAGLPAFLANSVKAVAFPTLAHSQLSVRENAIRLYATFLSRSPVSDLVTCLDDILDVLSLKSNLVDYGNGLKSRPACEEGGEDSAPQAVGRTPVPGLLSAFSAEGVLGLLAVVVRLVGAAGLHSVWAVLFPTLFKYLGHPASTVRQITSKVFLEILVSTKADESEQSTALLCSVFLDLVRAWPAPSVDGDDFPPAIDGAADGGLIWECKEGLLLTYELLLNFVLAAHRRKLHPFASLTAVKQKSVSTLIRKESSRVSPEAQRTPVRPTLGLPPTDSKLGLMSPLMSPWISSPANAAFPTENTPMSKSKPPAGLTLPNSSEVIRRPLQPASLFDRLCMFVPKFPSTSPFHAGESDSVWWRIVMQLVDSLADGRFELRRMADQVLPLLAEALLWADAASLNRLWLCATACASARHTASCMVVGRTLSLCVRRLKRLQLNVQALAGIGGSDIHALCSGAPTACCPICGLRFVTACDTTASATPFSVDVDCCQCVQGRVVRVIAQLRHMLAKHLQRMLSFTLSAPSDAVLVLMCETLLLLRENLSQFPDSSSCDVSLADVSRETIDEETPTGPSTSVPTSRILSVILNRVFLVISIYDKAGLPSYVSNSLSPPMAPRSRESNAVQSPQSVLSTHSSPRPVLTHSDSVTDKSIDSPLLSPVYGRRVLTSIRSSGCFTPRQASASARGLADTISSQVSGPNSDSNQQTPRSQRTHRAELLDRSLSLSLSPLLPPVLPYLSAREKLSLLPLLAYWATRQGDANAKLGSLECTQTCAADLLALSDVQSLCWTRLTRELSSTSSGGVAAPPGSRKHFRRPSPLVQLPSPGDDDSSESSFDFADQQLAVEIVDQVASVVLRLLSSVSVHELAFVRPVLNAVRQIMLNCPVVSLYEDVLLAVADKFRGASCVVPHGDTSRSAPTTPVRKGDSKGDSNGIVSISMPPTARAAKSDTSTSDGSSHVTESSQDPKASVSPLPVPDPKLWRGPMLDTAAARVSRTSSRVMGLSVDFTGDGVSPLDDTMSSPASIQQVHSGKSATRKSRQKDTSEVVTVSDTNIDDVLLAIDELSPAKGAAEPVSLSFDCSADGDAAATLSPERKAGTDLFGDHDVAVEKIVSDASGSEASSPSSSESGGDWDDWDAESDTDTVSAPVHGSSSVDPTVSEVSAFLRSLRDETPVAISSLGFNLVGPSRPVVESPFETALQRQLSSNDAFVVQWLLRSG